MQYWINTVSRAHVLTGVGGGFTQADHGRDTRLRQLRREAPIQPLIPGLAFIEDKQRWGFPFRRGLFRVERADFAQIAAAMGVALDPAVT